MSDFKSLNGYNVKDEVARNGVASLNTSVSDLQDYVDIEVQSVVDRFNELEETLVIPSTAITGNLYFTSGAGFDSNILQVDLSGIEDEYKYVNLIPMGDGTPFIKIPLDYTGKYTLSASYPCYARITTSTYIDEWYGSASFEVKVEDNKIKIRCFNSPLHIRYNLSGGTLTSTEIKLDSNGSMIVSGGASGLYHEFTGIMLSNN